MAAGTWTGSMGYGSVRANATHRAASRLPVLRPAVLTSRGTRQPCRALGNLPEVTNDDIEKLPWAAPGYRNAYVSAQPPEVQTAIIAGVTLLGTVLTYLNYTTVGPWVCENVPFFDRYMATAPFIQGPLFALAGVAHFLVPESFTCFYPVRGAWGFWYLPGTPSFHVYWTGVAEVLGGVGITLGATNLPFVPNWLLPASGFGLFLLVAAVTPSNMYMWTHNSPGPTPEETLAKTGGVIPLQGHLFRAFLQVVLLSTFLAVAFPPN